MAFFVTVFSYFSIFVFLLNFKLRQPTTLRPTCHVSSSPKVASHLTEPAGLAQASAGRKITEDTHRRKTTGSHRGSAATLISSSAPYLFHLGFALRTANGKQLTY